MKYRRNSDTHNYECIVFCSTIKRPATLQPIEQDHFNLVKLAALDALINCHTAIESQWQVHFAGTCGCVSKDTIFVIA